MDDWTAGYLREELIEPAVREATGFSKLLCDSLLETAKFEYRNDDTCHQVAVEECTILNEM